MGRGDKKSKKGKIAKGSFGNSRSRKSIKARLKKATSKKASSDTQEAAKPAKRVARKKEA